MTQCLWRVIATLMLSFSIATMFDTKQTNKKSNKSENKTVLYPSTFLSLYFFLHLSLPSSLSIPSFFSSCVPSLFSFSERIFHLYNFLQFSSVQSLSRVRLCNPMNHSTPGLPVHHQLPEFTQTHVHWLGDAIQPSHPLSSPSPPAPNPSQHQSLFQWVNSSHEVAKVLEFQL